MSDLHLLRPPDLAARPPRPAARARRHLAQHRQREHRRLHAPGGGARRRAVAAGHPRRRSHGAGAQLGTGVDVQSYRRIRDDFLDLQYRAQNMSLGDHDRPLGALDQVELVLRRAERRRHRRALDKFWSAWGDVANAPSRPPRARRSSTRRATLTRASTTSRRSSRRRAPGAGTSTRDHRRRRRHQPDRQRAGRRSTAIRSAVLPARAERPARPPRPPARPALEHGQVSVTQSPAGSVDVSFGGVTLVDADDTTGVATVPAGTLPQTLTTSPGGKLGALLDLQSATGPIGSYQTDLAAVAASLADGQRRLHARTPARFFTSRRRHDRPATDRRRRAGDLVDTRRRPGASAANDVALAIRTSRGGDADKMYAAARREDRHRVAGGAARGGDRAVARQRPRGPPPERRPASRSTRR